MTNKRSKDELIKEIQLVAKENNTKQPTAEMFSDHPETASPDTVHRHFGSWNKGVKAARCIPNRVSYDKEELYQQIIIASKDSKYRQPTIREFKQHPDTASVKQIRTKCGGFGKALRKLKQEGRL